MSTAAPARVMTTAELLAMPDDDVERWLIRGQLREKREDHGMTRRNRFHSRVMVRLAHLLEAWLERQPEPRGQVLCGEAGICLAHDPDTTVGVDVAYVGGDVLARQTDDCSIIDGVPVLVAEILSPSDTVEEVKEKLDSYRAAGVPLVWVINPYDRTVKMHRQNALPDLVNFGQELSAEPHLPGFRAPVARLFE